MVKKILCCLILFLFQSIISASEDYYSLMKQTESNCQLQILDSGKKQLNCPSKSLQMSYFNRFHQGDKRDVVYQLPQGNPPEEGWPVVYIYQGTGYFAPNFMGKEDSAFASYHRVELIQKLLDNGYAVIAPSARFHAIWETGAMPNNKRYQETDDYYFLSTLFKKVAAGEFGPINSQVQFATGISSGGYNSSRMAVSFPGQFKALAIQSGSFATCLGVVCVIPKTLPKNHPPTLLLHGGRDIIVPVFTARAYYSKLKQEGVDTEIYVEPSAGHEWLKSSPERILNWFNRYR